VRIDFPHLVIYIFYESKNFRIKKRFKKSYQKKFKNDGANNRRSDDGTVERIASRIGPTPRHMGVQDGTFAFP
jgi:hypothetical protein